LPTLFCPGDSGFGLTLLLLRFLLRPWFLGCLRNCAYDSKGENTWEEISVNQEVFANGQVDESE
jgi:hypothetical protein